MGEPPSFTTLNHTSAGSGIPNELSLLRWYEPITPQLNANRQRADSPLGQITHTLVMSPNRHAK
jgi:hypothetical protein